MNDGEHTPENWPFGITTGAEIVTEALSGAHESRGLAAIVGPPVAASPALLQNTAKPSARPSPFRCPEPRA